MKTKFGFEQFFLHTPDLIKKIRLGLNYFIGASLIYLPAIANWFNTTADNISLILGFALLILNTLLQMFGIEDNSIAYRTTFPEPTAPPNPGTTPTTIVGGRPDDKQPPKKP